jgi:hypothetical protein
MDLALWIQEKLVTSSTTLRLNGEPCDGEELARELARRLDGFDTFCPLLTVDGHSPIGWLSAVRGETLFNVDVEPWLEAWLRKGRRRPATVKTSVARWFFGLPEPERRQSQTSLMNKYLETGQPGAASNVTLAIIALKAFDAALKAFDEVEDS